MRRAKAWHDPICGLGLLEQGLMKSRATIIVPFDNRVIFVRSLNRPEFPSRRPEVAQTLDSISGIQFLVGGRRFGKWWSLGSLRVRNRPWVRKRRLERFTQLGHSAYLSTPDSWGSWNRFLLDCRRIHPSTSRLSLCGSFAQRCTAEGRPRQEGGFRYSVAHTLALL